MDLLLKAYKEQYANQEKINSMPLCICRMHAHTNIRHSSIKWRTVKKITRKQ